MRVRARLGGPYYYPDLAVVCGQQQFEDAKSDTLLNPKVLMEILSPTTERYDRGEKFEIYKQIPSLTDYLLIAQDRVQVERYVLGASGWERTITAEPNGIVELASIKVQLALADIYYDVFPSP